MVECLAGVAEQEQQAQQQASVLVDALCEQGWVVLPNFVAPPQLAELRQVALTAWEQGQFRAAGIGQGASQALHPAIRGDAVWWLDEQTTGAVAGYQQRLEQLRQHLNQALYLGLFETELHFARYAPGSFYRRHIDNFQGSSARLVTVILYLNEANWQPQDGGALRLYLTSDNVQDILPQGGTLVAFLSERFEHEVLPAQRARLSLTGWLRRRS